MGKDWAPNLMRLPSEQEKEKAERWRQERQFMMQHKDDTDQMLLNYFRKLADTLGHIPTKEETVGYVYLKQRLGNWPTILIRAGLKEKRINRKEMNRQRDGKNQGLRDGYDPRFRVKKKDKENDIEK